MSLCSRKFWPALVGLTLLIPAAPAAAWRQDTETPQTASNSAAELTSNATQSLAPEGLAAIQETRGPDPLLPDNRWSPASSAGNAAPETLQPRVAARPRPFQSDEGRWDFVPAPQQLSQPLALTPVESRESVPAMLASQSSQSTPRLRVVSQSPQSANIHRASQFRFLVVNDGPIIAQSVNLTIHIQGQGRVVSTFPDNGVQQTDAIYFAAGDLEVGQSREFGFEFQPDAPGQIRVEPRITSSFSSSVTTAVTAPRVEIEFQGASEFVVGQRISQTIRLRNDGSEAVRNLIVRQACTPANLIENTGFEGNRFIVPVLAPGQIAELTLTATAVQPGDADIQIAVEGDNVRGLSSKTLSFARNHLSAIFEGPELTYINSVGTWSIRLTNDQDRAVDDVRVSLELPDGMIVKVLDRNADFDAASSTITWSLPTLPPGQTEIIPFKATISRFGSHVIKASISNAAGTMTHAQMSTQAIGRADIDLKVVTTPDPVETGSLTSIMVQVQNRGTHDATDISVQLILPDVIEPIESADYEMNGQHIAFENFQLGPGQTRNLTIPVKCREAGDHIIRATVQSSASTKPIAAENSLFIFSSESTRTAGRTSEDR